MHRSQSRAVMAAAVVAAAFVSILAGLVTIASFNGANGGDLAVSSTSLTIPLLLVLALVVRIGIELRRLRSERRRRTRSMDAARA